MKRLWILAWLPLWLVAGELQLAQVAPVNIDPAPYFISEKYDGIRGHWTGQQLLSKQGRVLAAPAWFIAALPDFAVDGELWAGRGGFQQVAAAVLDSTPNDRAWRQIRYMLFDLPEHPGPFSIRQAVLKRWVEQQQRPWLRWAPQLRLTSRQALAQHLATVVDGGGEGLMLHRADALYDSGRTGAVLKLKPLDDMEGTVVAIIPGKGRFSGMMGSLLLRLDSGQTFKLGTGFSHAQRRQPPAVGSRVTFAYQGLTNAGKPRFARFLRVRPPGS